MSMWRFAVVGLAIAGCGESDPPASGARTDTAAGQHDAAEGDATAADTTDDAAAADAPLLGATKVNCALFAACGDCVKAVGCGWCTDAGGKCLPGTALGPLMPCAASAFQYGPAASCSQ